MTILRNIALLALIALAGWPCAAARADPVLTPFSAEYKIRISIVRGESKLTLRSAGSDEYVLESRARARGLLGLFVRGGIEESSRFALRKGRVVPIRYRRTDSVSKDKRDLELDFDWDTGTVQSRYGDMSEEMPIPANAMDPSLLPIAIMVDRMYDRDPGPYTMIERGRTEILNVLAEERETVKTRAGSFETVPYSHHAEEVGRTTRLWAAPDLGYIMVRMAQFDGKKRRASLELMAIRIGDESAVP